MDDALIVQRDAAICDGQVGQAVGGLAHAARIEAGGGRSVSLMHQDRILVGQAEAGLLLRTLRGVVGRQLHIEDLHAALEIDRTLGIPAAVRQHVERAVIDVAVAPP
jgi:hypothetical protein